MFKWSLFSLLSPWHRSPTFLKITFIPPSFLFLNVQFRCPAKYLRGYFWLLQHIKNGMLSPKLRKHFLLLQIFYKNRKFWFDNSFKCSRICRLNPVNLGRQCDISRTLNANQAPTSVLRASLRKFKTFLPKKILTCWICKSNNRGLINQLP